VKYLNEKGKLERVVSPLQKSCSYLLTQAGKEKIDSLEGLKKKLAYK
jgi:hypothetical protein